MANRIAAPQVDKDKIITTFHYGEKLSYLKHYLECCEYVALGGVAQLKAVSKLTTFFDTCWTLIRQYWPKKIHGFGMSSLPILLRYPFYSIDSTTWQTPSRFGDRQILERGRFYRAPSPKKIISDNLRLPRDWVRFSKNPSYALPENIKQYLDMEQYVTDVWAKRGIVWDD